MIDYHIHTLLCNHAEGGIRSYAEAAVTAGLTEICFLDHLSLDRGSTAHAMHLSEVPFYVYAVDEVKRAFEGRIIIRTGLEIDFTPSDLPAIERLVDTFDFDLIGGSVHFVDGINIASRRHAASMAPAEFERLCRRYVERLLEMTEAPFFDVLCHLDVIKKNGHTPPADITDGLKAVIDRLAEKNLALEVNSGGLAHPAKACYPDEGLLAHALSRGIALTTGSDAHTPQSVGAGLETALATLTKLGATHQARFDKRRRTLVPLSPQETP